MRLLLARLAALCLALTWAGGTELQREGRTRNHGHSVCSTWGDFHYKTFDGDVFRFPGLCDYNFASDCRDAYKEFALHLKRGPSSSGGPSQVEHILLTVKDDTIYLTRQLTVLNGAMVSTPHYSPGLLIQKTDAYTKVYSRAGLALMWNREDSVMLELDSKFRNHTCGLCGDYNGLQTYSEFLSEGVAFSPVEFGNMQKVNKPEAVCEDPEDTVVPESCSEHRAECEQLLTAAAFESCQGLVPLELYVQACAQDRCRCPQNASCVCSTIAEFSRQCSHAGGRPENWRTDAFCPKSCPGNMVYLESGSPCMDTCSHLEVSNLCEEHRMDGCFCPEGTVFDDIAGGGCIPVSQCGCKLHGHLYTPGQEVTNACEQCVCNAGRWVCRDLQCPGTCSLEGGAHISTFDGRKYTFHGDCYYVLTKTLNDSYALLGELAPCGFTDKQTCLKTVALLADGKKNVVAFKSDGSVLLNELKVNLPHVTASFSIFQPSSYHLVVTTSFGLKLQIQLLPVMQLFLTLDQAAQGLVQGLCGNFNGLEGDDFRTAGGLVEATGAGFANTWKAQSSCSDKLDWLDDPCALSIESANYAEHWCSLLKKTKSPFARCHSAVDPAEYYKRCKYDACNCQSAEDCMCAALSSYARACAAKGVMLWGWREHVCNKDLDSCPKSQVFLYNLTACQQTCRSLSESDTHCLQGFAPVDGCGCPDHMYLDEKGRCVPLAKCSCYYRGLYLEAGEVVLRQEERCVCRNGRLSCIQVKLIGQACEAPKINVDCSNVTALSTRSPRPVSCQTLAAGYYQTECISGCVCPEGLIDDGRGGCVVEEACPCVHNSDLYLPGDKIRVDCNTCTCQKGRWACTQSVCHGTCTIYGNGHYITFDGKHYDFDGHCSYVAVQDYCGQNTSLGSFSIITENVPCGTTGVTCSKAIKIFIGRTVLKLEDRHCTVIQRDVGHDVAYTTRDVGQYLVVEASIGVIVIWDRKTTIFIKLDPSYEGAVCGLCGNFDQRSKNDFTTRDSMVVDSELDFGNSWKEASTCPDVRTTPDPCTANLHRRSWSEKQCSIIKSRVFGLCHSKVDPMPFYEACVQDSCSCDTGGDCECFCSAVASYAQQCTKEGACVFWRTPDLCPIFCDYYNPPGECEWHYEPCGNRSFETCRTVNGIHSNISVSYLEGCYPRCPKHSPIYDEELKACVTRDKCGCYVGNTHYAPGTPVPTGQTCHSCVCTDSSEVVCRVDEGKIVSVIQNGSFCYWEFCGPNGTVEKHFNVFSCCFWSDWINNDHPSDNSDGGDRETFDGICGAPHDIECRAATEPFLSWETLGQKAQCNVSVGFICKNEDQFGNEPFGLCYDYEIRVYCCQQRDEDSNPNAHHQSPSNPIDHHHNHHRLSKHPQHIATHSDNPQYNSHAYPGNHYHPSHNHVYHRRDRHSVTNLSVSAGLQLDRLAGFWETERYRSRDSNPNAHHQSPSNPIDHHHNHHRLSKHPQHIATHSDNPQYNSHAYPGNHYHPSHNHVYHRRDRHSVTNLSVSAGLQLDRLAGFWETERYRSRDPKLNTYNHRDPKPSIYHDYNRDSNPNTHHHRDHHPHHNHNHRDPNPNTHNPKPNIYHHYNRDSNPNAHHQSPSNPIDHHHNHHRLSKHPQHIATHSDNPQYNSHAYPGNHYHPSHNHVYHRRDRHSVTNLSVSAGLQLDRLAGFWETERYRSRDSNSNTHHQSPSNPIDHHQSPSNPIDHHHNHHRLSKHPQHIATHSDNPQYNSHAYPGNHYHPSHNHVYHRRDHHSVTNLCVSAGLQLDRLAGFWETERYRSSCMMGSVGKATLREPPKGLGPRGESRLLENESWWMCNCTKATCKYNNTVELVKVPCEPPPMPTCTNGLTPVRVQDPDKCCWHWECDCYCTGWGDPHYVTFDGLYYSYQGNCTYVLVEEVSPRADNFGIYVDNYHCDVNDEVSCPRMLIVRHETQEVLIKTVQMAPIVVQVQVNRQAVALPYTKFGLRVYESGINYMVDIPELGALVSYNGLSFSIRLPYRLFGNNTKGQCGTCTNSTLDDCVLPSGESIDNCEVAADSWVVSDPSKPRCPHTSFTTRRPATSPSAGTSSFPPKSCASPLCELIKDSLFAQCHALAPPQHYYEACLFDSCYVPGSNLECASLQTYAALCAQEGICVDWRNHTGGACRCVGPDNVPREYGEHFEFDCKDCICLEGGSGIICKPKTCRPQPRLECEEDGTSPFTEVDPANTCCSLASCKCNASLCREKPPLCSLGFQLKSETVPGRCCPLYSCVYSSKCQNCVCTDRRDNATQLNVITCTYVPCNTTCSPGFELVDAPGECCKKCEQTRCIISRPGQQSLVLKPGDMKSDPLNNCTFFSCVKIHNQLISSISNITCPDFDPSTCVQGSITLMPNGCCRKCIPRNETSVPCAAVPVTREISHNGCTASVSMNDCSGSCGTFAMYSAEAQALDHRCSCCREQRTSQREVTLRCPDGGTLRYTYTHVDSCLCQDTLCELPAQRRARRSSPLGVAPGRG
ncbi:hypothetical protein MG293_020134 [Ovis ammon polii]|uniref:Mucin-2 n=1 Tax=Ovis ammon polii TaxID=230172 RepID=A0AAD4Y0L4_OVIAM|nr:hypothetical protein MG293_020134 [Ovis ammon polii]